MNFQAGVGDGDMSVSALGNACATVMISMMGGVLLVIEDDAVVAAGGYVSSPLLRQITRENLNLFAAPVDVF